MSKDIIITEEYSKFTTGMFNVVLSHAKASPNSQILVNHSHWILDSSSILNNKLSIHFLGLRRFFLYYRRILRFFYPIGRPYCYRLLLRSFSIILFPFEILAITHQLFSLPSQSKIYVHIGGWPAGFRARLYLLILLIRRIGSNGIYLIIHNFPIVSSSFFVRLTQNLYSLIFNFFSISSVTVSHGAASKLRAFFPGIVVVYNGCSPSSRATLSSSSTNESTIFNASSLCSRAKLKMLICTSFHPLKSTGKFIPLLYQFADVIDITWVGPVDTIYFEEIFSENIDPSFINFVGFSDSVPAYIQSHDFIFMPGLQYESFGMLAIEAAMYSKVSLCFSHTPTAELFDKNISGLHCNASSQSLYRELSKIVKLGKPYLDELGMNAYQVYMSNYTSTCMHTNYSLLGH